MLISSDLLEKKRTSVLQELLLAVLEYTHTRRTKKIVGRVRPSFIWDVVGRIFPRKDIPDTIRLTGLYPLLIRDCRGELGITSWYVESLTELSVPLVEEVPCTPRISQLRNERFDEDILNTRKSKKK